MNRKSKVWRILSILSLTGLFCSPAVFGQIMVGSPTTFSSSSLGIAAPQGLAFHPVRNSIFILDANNKVTEINLNGQLIQSFELNFPFSGGGLSYDWMTGQLLVTNDLKVFKVSATGSSVEEIVDLDGDVFSSEGIAVHPQSGNLWIADAANEEIVQVDRSGNFLSSFGTRAILNSFTEPTGISFLENELLIVDDLEGTRSLYRVSTSGQLLQTVAQTTTFGVSDPEGVTVVGETQIWICGDADDKVVKLLRLDNANQEPIANAGPNQTVGSGDLVTLDGSASDPDGDALTFSWIQVEGPAVTLSNSNTTTATFVAPAVEQTTPLRFKFEVSDGAVSVADTTTVTVSPAPITFYFPQVGDGVLGPPFNIRFRSSLILVSRGDAVNATVDFFDSDGDPMTLTLSDSGTGSSFDLNLAAGEAVALATPGTGELKVGYARVTADAELGGTVVFSRFDTASGVLLYEAGVPASNPHSSFSLFVDSLEDRDTGLAMVNPADAGAVAAAETTTTLRLYDQDLNLLSEKVLELLPGEHLARFIFELFPEIEGQASEMRGVLVVDSDRPLAALTLRQNDAPDVDFPAEVPTLTTFPVVSPSDEESGTFFFPQVGNGLLGAPFNLSFQTSLILVSQADPVSVQIDFFDSQGSPMPVTLEELGTDSTFDLNLEAGSAVALQTSGTGDLQVGYARVTANANLGGTAVFTRRDVESGTVLYEAGVPVAEPLQEFSLFVDSLGDRNTGFAIVNPLGSGESATVTMSLYDKQFNLLAEESVQLPSGQHLARYVPEIFATLDQQAEEMEGVLVVSSNVALAAITLRQNDAGDLEFPQEVPTLTTFPVIP